ncbi:ComF family protein [Pseudoalteromonas sp. T1lg23B]|uniref:ComF family protein n=1 Tax=Pseudoalteromonas sp. T1lg23B TaxID=2077097 RepID=UPI001319C62A|nr:phosphoribosyltransferase family protein [Pseudoalteromonas sp. T1lg23B]
MLRPDVARLVNLPHCEGLVACGWYQGALKVWLSEYKFHQRSHHKAVLQQLITYQMQRFWLTGNFLPDVCFIMPLSNRRYFWRGFNQVTQTWMPALQGISPISSALTRIKSTKPQSILNRKQRRSNIKGAFSVKLDLQGKKVVIVDDVITTGSTMDEAAQACLEAGAAKVWAFATALTPLLGK